MHFNEAIVTHDLVHVIRVSIVAYSPRMLNKILYIHRSLDYTWLLNLHTFLRPVIIHIHTLHSSLPNSLLPGNLYASKTLAHSLQVPEQRYVAPLGTHNSTFGSLVSFG